MKLPPSIVTPSGAVNSHVDEVVNQLAWPIVTPPIATTTMD